VEGAPAKQSTKQTWRKTDLFDTPQALALLVKSKLLALRGGFISNQACETPSANLLMIRTH